MSIENNIERIATALEAIAASMLHPQVKIDLTPPEPKPKKAPPAPIAAPAAPVAVAPGESMPFAGGVLSNPAGAPPAPVAPAPVALMTAEELNAALVAEVGRLGSPDGISNTIRELGYSGIRDMPASLYQELLNRVKAL